MKKLLNLTKNETIDVVSEDTIHFRPPRLIGGGIASVSEETKYLLIKPRPEHWEDTDEYKIIEI